MRQANHSSLSLDPRSTQHPLFIFLPDTHTSTPHLYINNKSPGFSSTRSTATPGLSKEHTTLATMNTNFLGAPTREDLQALDSLRGQLAPLVGLIDKLQHNTRVYLERGIPPDPAQSLSAITRANAILSRINATLNGSYQYTPKITEKGSKAEPGTFRDLDIEGQKDRIEALHAFPVAPYPMGNERLGGMATILLDKRLGPLEEKWVEERLQKARDFAYVPGDLEIEPRKPAVVTDAAEDDEELTSNWVNVPTKRMKCALSEDELMELWGLGHRTVFDKQYGQDRGLGEENFDEDEEEEEEMEDALGGEAQDEVMADGDEESEEPTPKALPSLPVQMLRRAQPAGHAPVVGAPRRPSEHVHRFMETEAQ
jgi:hypothetical protein